MSHPDQTSASTTAATPKAQTAPQALWGWAKAATKNLGGRRSEAASDQTTGADSPVRAVDEGEAEALSFLRQVRAALRLDPKADTPETPVIPGDAEENERLVRTEFWTKTRSVLGKVPFVKDAIASYYCVRDPATPASSKAVLLGALAYFILPVDVMPDILAGIGYSGYSDFRVA